MKKYLKLIKRSTKMKCLGAIVLAFCGSMLGSIWPVRLGDLYTQISKGEIHSITQGSIVIGSFGVIYLAAEVINIARRVFMDCTIVNHEKEIRQKSIEKMLKRPIKEYFGNKISGEQTAQMNQGVTGLSQLIKITCNDVVATVLTAICTLLQVMLNAPVVIALVMLFYLVITMIISIFQIRSQNGIRELIIAKKNKLDGQVCQSISNIELIKNMHAEAYEVERLKPDINAISKTEKYHHKYMGVFDCLKQVCKVVFQGLLLFLSIYLIGIGYMDAGSVITVCLLFQQLIKPIDEVYRFMDETASAIVKAKELSNIMGKESELVNDVAPKVKKEKSSDIILKKVLVQSPDETKKLAYYDYLHIPGKKMVAIKGESGSGKTTLMRCLNRFYAYSSGDIDLFGYDLNSYSQEELSNTLFCVPQKTFLFAGSVRENLLYGLKNKVTDEEMQEALRKACLLEALTNKAKDDNLGILDYYIGEGGSGLSGGEAQRLSIARALLRSPQVYFFDESTSALDEMTTKKVLENIKSHALSIDAGVIIIAHTRNVIESCDMVIELQNKIKFYKDTKHFEKFA